MDALETLTGKQAALPEHGDQAGQHRATVSSIPPDYATAGDTHTVVGDSPFGFSCTLGG